MNILNRKKGYVLVGKNSLGTMRTQRDIDQQLIELGAYN